VAAAVFARKGVASATVRDIADEAGILSGSLYHHFESKDQMVAEVLEPFITTMTAKYTATRESLDDPVDILRQFMLATVVTVAAMPDQARILHNEAIYLRETPQLQETDRKRQEPRKMWIAVVRRGQREGKFRKDLDPDVVVRAMFDATLSSSRWLPPRGTSNPHRIGLQLAEVFLDGLRNQ
jgi:AcrR family transcriptional regulator